MGQILTKTVFLLKMSHITAKLCFPFVLKLFSGKVTKNSLISKKKWANPEENLNLFKQPFLIKPVNWTNTKLPKTVFLLKMSHIQLNYAFLLFCSVLGEIP